MSETNDTNLALEALHRACAARRVTAGLVHHTDRGSPYASEESRAVLVARGMRQSIRRKGACWDAPGGYPSGYNAVAENLLSSLRADLVDHRVYANERAVEQSIGFCIDGFYILDRLHSRLNYVNANQLELMNRNQSIAA